MPSVAQPTSEQIAASAYKLLVENPLFKVGSATIRGNEYRVFENAPSSLVGIFAHGANHGDKKFLFYEGDSWSFAEIWSQARRFANALSAGLGVKQGDRVAIAMRNYPEWITSYMGAISLGAVVVPLNAWWKTEELHYALNDCDAKIVIVDAKRLST
jgi:long-chain acyl-CoA synthetase